MIKIKPSIDFNILCSCGNDTRLTHNDLIWQGVHICTKSSCQACGKDYLCDLPIGQSRLTSYMYDIKARQLLANNMERATVANSVWYSSILNRIIEQPNKQEVEIDIEILKPNKDVIILNTLDFLYGHSLLSLLNLQNILNHKEGLGVIVVIQPFLRWMVPDHLVSEIWTVHLKMPQMKHYYSKLNQRINKELERFDRVFISAGHVLPHPVNIEQFTQIQAFDFATPNPRITYAWREDVGRLWIKSKIIQKGFEIIGLKKILLIAHFLKIILFLSYLRFKVGKDTYRLTIAGLGTFGRFPGFIEDRRVNTFTVEDERNTCKVYAESILIVGIHGSSMILPSAHAGMTISLTPHWKWGNGYEDLLYREADVRLACFQKRVLPSSLSIRELVKVCLIMIEGRSYFIKKFIHNPIEL